MCRSSLVRLCALLAASSSWLPSLVPQVAAQRDSSPLLCEADDSYNSTSVPYEFNNNAWGDDGSGESCLQINNGGESWSVTSKWTGNPETVKAFPRMKADPWNLPVRFWNVSNVDFRAEFTTYVKGTEGDSEEEQHARMHETYVRSNAALDVFLSDDAENSTLVGPPIEIMIWFWYTPTIVPLGYHPPTPDTPRVEVDGMNFTLYDGFNDMNQHVFSWLAERNMTRADADYSALFRYIWENGMLSGNLWLGQLEFGFEYMHAGEETVSEVKSNYTLLLRRDGDPDASTSSATPTSTSSRAPTSTSSSSVEASLTATSSPTDDAAAATSNPAIRLTPAAVDSGIFNLFGIWSAIIVLAASLTVAHSL